jgi:hypothetical protein
MVGPIRISANDESHQPTHHRRYRHWVQSHVFYTPNTQHPCFSLRIFTLDIPAFLGLSDGIVGRNSPTQHIFELLTPYLEKDTSGSL